MKDTAEVLAAEDRFLDALTRSDTAYLKRILADDFIMIDVLSGQQIPRTEFLNALESSTLKFPALKRAEPSVRFYDTTAIVTGSVLMSIHMGGQAMTVSSRYTHVYAEQDGRWRLVSAQGTPVTTPLPAAA